MTSIFLTFLLHFDTKIASIKQVYVENNKIHIFIFARAYQKNVFYSNIFFSILKFGFFPKYWNPLFLLERIRKLSADCSRIMTGVILETTNTNTSDDNDNRMINGQMIVDSFVEQPTDSHIINPLCWVVFYIFGYVVYYYGTDGNCFCSLQSATRLPQFI